MKTLHFSTTIEAPRAKVWDTIIDPESYKEWTAPFQEGSYYEGSWNTGDRIRFLSPDGGGMTSVIAENRPQEFISIKHLGEVKDGVEDTSSENVRRWAPAFENYTLRTVGNTTEVKIDIDVAPDFEQYMRDSWPRALDKLKTLSEAA